MASAGTKHRKEMKAHSPARRDLENKILAMRRDGMNVAQIARELEYSETYVKKCLQSALKTIIIDNVEDLRKMENQKLDRLEREVMAVLQAFHPLVSSGEVVRDTIDDENGVPLIDPETGKFKTYKLKDAGPVLAAVAKAISVMERRAKMLGLDMPTKVAQTTPDGEKEATVVVVASPQDLKL